MRLEFLIMCHKHLLKPNQKILEVWTVSRIENGDYKVENEWSKRLFTANKHFEINNFYD